MVSKRQKTVRVDVDKLRNLLKKKGLSYEKFAEPFGHSGSWISHMILSGWCIPQDVIAIKALYGVDITDTNPEPKQHSEKVVVNPTDLSNVENKLDTVNNNLEQLNKTMHQLGNLLVQLVEYSQPKKEDKK